MKNVVIKYTLDLVRMRDIPQKLEGVAIT